MQFRATIAGDGELRTTLMAQAEALGIRDRIDFPGWIGPEDKAAFFNGLDVVCFTSEWDVQGITILESFAWRKALIGTDVDGPSSCYADGETALVVPPMDPPALAHALRRLHDDPALRRRLAENGRAQAERNYSDEVIAGLLDRHVSELVARHRGTRAGAAA
jgi:glycosyltransferase involved in cell wall biosynthesis